MVQAYLAEYQPDTLSNSGSDAEKHTFQRQLECELVLLATTGQDGDGDARQGDQHGQPGMPRHRLAQHKPARDARHRWRQRHEELTVT